VGPRGGDIARRPAYARSISSGDMEPTAEGIGMNEDMAEAPALAWVGVGGVGMLAMNGAADVAVVGERSSSPSAVRITTSQSYDVRHQLDQIRMGTYYEEQA